jgi:uncharacterized RmlC-like cupin family protein
MAERDRILVVTPGDRKPGPSTPGMDRQEAFATDRMWSGMVRTDVGMVSGWHHHGEYETTIYVLTGGLTMEFGPDGSTTVEAGPGDFLYVPKGVVHRESNPSAEPADIVVVRAGQGESTINVPGPAPSRTVNGTPGSNHPPTGRSTPSHGLQTSSRITAPADLDRRPEGTPHRSLG